MKISYSELILLGHPVLENVETLQKAGGKNVELMMDGAAWDRCGGNYGAMAEELKRTGLHFSVHPAAWDINLTAEMGILRDAAYRHHLAALEFCAQLGASQMVVHPGFAYSPAFDKETAKKRARETICRLAEEAKKTGVKLAFENVGYHGASIYTQEEYIHALDGVDPIVGYLIDVGHAHVNAWDISGTIDAVSHRLYGLHLHDNHGNCDAHLPMGEGTIPWDQVLAAMGRIQTPECEFVLEYAPMQPLERLRGGEEMLGSIVNKQGT